MHALDAETWDGPPAPEGSELRREARARLWSMARRAARVTERPPREWRDGVLRSAPQLVGAVGAADVDRIARCAWRLP